MHAVATGTKPVLGPNCNTYHTVRTQNGLSPCSCGLVAWFFFPISDLYVLQYNFFCRIVSLDCAGNTDVLSHISQGHCITDYRSCPPPFPD